MFQFPTFAHLAVWLAFNQPGYPIRISRDQRLFAPPPSFSQLITSFFASESLGIHRLPFFYFFILTSQFSYTIIQSLHDTVGFFIFSSFYAFLKIRFKFHSYVQLIYLHISFDIRNLFSVLSIMSKNSSFRFFCFRLLRRSRELLFHKRFGQTAKFVENNGFEPLTPCLQSRCSSQLS